jgi:hypothetical protein
MLMSQPGQLTALTEVAALVVSSMRRGAALAPADDANSSIRLIALQIMSVHSEALDRRYAQCVCLLFEHNPRTDRETYSECLASYKAFQVRTVATINLSAAIFGRREAAIKGRKVCRTRCEAFVMHYSTSL